MPRRFYDIAVAVGIGALVWHRRPTDRAASQTPAVAERTLHAPLAEIELIDSQVAEVTAEVRGRLVYSITPALLFLASLALLLYPQYTNALEFRQLIGGSIGLSAQEIVAVNLALLALVATLTVALVVGGSASRASAQHSVGEQLPQRSYRGSGHLYLSCRSRLARGDQAPRLPARDPGVCRRRADGHPDRFL
ncbi:hypothetical protein [Nocardioides aurantiacus]|uniref:hypothetical protein n=1 Tax=Nocardioides aurantiacus TaxID=86796 RepID=UPI0011CE9E1E|nr:hypothetical protein [Nocardioides aurantiacus]